MLGHRGNNTNGAVATLTVDAMGVALNVATLKSYKVTKGSEYQPTRVKLET